MAKLTAKHEEEVEIKEMEISYLQRSLTVLRVMEAHGDGKTNNVSYIYSIAVIIIY